MAFGRREMGKGCNLFDWAANESVYAGALSIDRCANTMLQGQFIPKCRHHGNGGWISTDKTLFSLMELSLLGQGGDSSCRASPSMFLEVRMGSITLQLSRQWITGVPSLGSSHHSRPWLG